MSGVADDDDEWSRADVTLKPLNDQSKMKKPVGSISVPILPASNRYNSSSNNPPYETNAGPIPTFYNQSNNNYYPQNNIIQVNPLPDDQIDSALLSAMSNPRERMQLFQIEDTILKFVKSNEKLLEFPPVHNSFRRLLAYRVGQRFGLSHSTTDSNFENGEKSITLFKTPSSAPPKTLLIDLNIPVDTTMNINDDTLDYSNAAQFIASHPVSIESIIATSAPVAAPSKKVQLMKRSAGKQSSEGVKVLVTKQQQTEEDREKAYNEARARIFGDGEVPSNLDGCSINPSNSSDKLSSSQSQKVSSSSSPSVPSSSTSSNVVSGKQSSVTSNSSKTSLSGKSTSSQIHKSPSDTSFEAAKTHNSGTLGRKVNSSSSLASDSNSISTQSAASKGSKSSARVETSTPPSTGSTDKDKSSKSNSNNDSPVEATAAAMSNTSGKHSKASHSSTNSNSNNTATADKAANISIRKKPVDAGSWKGNKSQVRDLDAERSDPDFVRRSSPSLLVSGAAQQQQLQQQQGRQASMNVNAHMNMPMSGVHMPHASDGMIYMQNAPNSGPYMNMMQASSNPATGAPPAMYGSMPPQLDSSQMIYTNPHHSAVSMAHPYGAAIINNNRTVPEGTYMAGDMSSNPNSNGGNQSVGMHEYPQNMQQSGPPPNGAYYPQNGPILLAPTLQQPVSILSAGPSAGQTGPSGVYYQQAAPGGGPLPWPPQQQHMNMVQVMSNGSYYPPHQSNQQYIASSSSAEQQQQQQYIQSQQMDMYPYNTGNGNPTTGYYEYPPPAGYYQQPPSQQQGQQYDTSSQSSPTKAKKGQQRIFYSSEFPPLG